MFVIFQELFRKDLKVPASSSKGNQRVLFEKRFSQKSTGSVLQNTEFRGTLHKKYLVRGVVEYLIFKRFSNRQGIEK
jgi:hypothetical protein